MTTARIRICQPQLQLISRAIELLNCEEAFIGLSIEESGSFVLDIDAQWLRAIADVVHEDDPELAKSLRRLHTKTRKQATVDWLKGKFGL